MAHMEIHTDVVTTSFYASHIITGAGVGGMTCFNSVDLKNKALSLGLGTTINTIW